MPWLGAAARAEPMLYAIRGRKGRKYIAAGRGAGDLRSAAGRSYTLFSMESIGFSVGMTVCFRFPDGVG